MTTRRAERSTPSANISEKDMHLFILYAVALTTFAESLTRNKRASRTRRHRSLQIAAAEPKRFASPSFDPDIEVVKVSAPSTPVDEVETLRSLFYETAGPEWLRQDGWSSLTTSRPSDPCGLRPKWYGVGCEDDDYNVPHVTRLTLVANNLQGSFPSVSFSHYDTGYHILTI